MIAYQTAIQAALARLGEPGLVYAQISQPEAGEGWLSFIVKEPHRQRWLRVHVGTIASRDKLEDELKTQLQAGAA